MNHTSNTLTRLRRLQQARAVGYPVSYTTDPAWLVQQAINRRGGFADDPGLTRGSCLPVVGKYPKKAIGETYNHLRLLASAVNTRRRIVHSNELGEWRKLLLARIPERITPRWDGTFAGGEWRSAS